MPYLRCKYEIVKSKTYESDVYLWTTSLELRFTSLGQYKPIYGTI